MTRYVVVSLSGSNLYVSVDPASNNGFSAKHVELESQVASNSKINDVNAFYEVLSGTIGDLTGGITKDLSIHILLEPSLVVQNFVTVRKNLDNIQEYMLSYIKNKNTEFNPDESFYGYQKIAPYIYQFLAVEKSTIEAFMNVTNMLGSGVAAIIPWSLVLPRFVKSKNPSIFVVSRASEFFITAVDLGWVYFTQSYSKTKTSAEISELVSQLAKYEREKPIETVYSLGVDDLKLKEGIKAQSLDINELESDMKNYTLHALYEKQITEDGVFLGSIANLTNVLPLPEVKESKVPMVAVGAGVVAAMALFVGGFFYFRNMSSVAPTDVLSESVNNEITETVESTESTNSEISEEVTEVIREDVTIEVLNGAGVAGIAGETQNTLNELGYNVSSIGNNTVNIEETLVRVKVGNLALAEAIKADLGEEFKINVAEDLDDDSEFDAVVIIGQN